MKKTILFVCIAVSVLSLISCGPSAEEKDAMKDTVIQKSITTSEDSLLKAMEGTDTLQMRSTETTEEK